MDVFDVFDLSDYTFLEVSRGGVPGSIIKNEYGAEGVFKLRSGMNNTDGQETKQSDATLHIRPEESFITIAGGIVGHGISVQGKDYQIVGCTAGDNYETGEREHYRLTLQATDYSKYVRSES